VGINESTPQIQSNVGCISSQAEIKISFFENSLVEKVSGKWSKNRCVFFPFDKFCFDGMNLGFCRWPICLNTFFCGQICFVFSFLCAACPGAPFFLSETKSGRVSSAILNRGCASFCSLFTKLLYSNNSPISVYQNPTTHTRFGVQIVRSFWVDLVHNRSDWTPGQARRTFEICPRFQASRIWSDRWWIMILIAFITFNSSLIPLIKGLCTSNPWEFESSGGRRKQTNDLEI